MATRVLKVIHDLAILGESEDVAIGFRIWPKAARNPQREFAHERPAGHGVECIARPGQADPDTSGFAAHEVVRISGQVIEYHLHSRRPRRNIRFVGVDAYFPYAI